MWRECDEKNWSEMNHTKFWLSCCSSKEVDFLQSNTLSLCSFWESCIWNFSTEKKKVQLQWSVKQFGPDEKNSDRKACESVLSLGIYWHICVIVGLRGFICQQNRPAFYVIEPLLLLVTLPNFSHVVCSSSHVFVTHVNFYFN